MPKKGKLKIVEIPLAQIDEPAGIVRLEINQDEVEALAASIREVGLLIPIGVRARGKRFEIVDGHRRYLAHKVLKLSFIACMVREGDDLQCAIARATENLGRVDLSPIEEAAIYADLRDNFKLSDEQIGKRMGRSPGVVKRRLDLLKMPAQLQKAIHRKEITYGVAEELVRLRDSGKIDYYLGYAVDHGITVAVARQWVNDELKRQRYEGRDVGGGGGALSPLDDKPIYVSCDICHDPVELGKDRVFRACPGCVSTILQALQG